jgi:hypothetical protein
MPSECPYCGSSQPFPLRTRPLGDSEVVIEVYISCTRCPYEHVIRQSTAKLERLRKRESNLETAKIFQVRRYGTPNSVNELSLLRIRQLMRKEVARLEQHQSQ